MMWSDGGAVRKPGMSSVLRSWGAILLGVLTLTCIGVAEANAQNAPKPGPYCSCDSRTKTWWCRGGAGGTGAAVDTRQRCSS